MPGRLTATTRARYNRIAPMYDADGGFTERAAFGVATGALVGCTASRVLEVGVGTGKNVILLARRTDDGD